MHRSIPIYKKAPIIRVLPPLVTGIVLQWHLQYSLQLVMISNCSFLAACLLFYLLPLAIRFKLAALQGLLFNGLLVAVGLLLTWHKDVRHTRNWYGHFTGQSTYLVVQLNEPLVEKSKSYKADAIAESMIINDSVIPVTGKLLLYFSKDSAGAQLQYGQRILIHKNLQAIKNTGNPGAFNYEQYAAFQQTFHNAFLKPADWIPLQQQQPDAFRQFLFSTREIILSILRKNMGGAKDELGIAEALLIGYTNDLDKDLVQAYSNTGVVHIIAISGMHLGLIYVLLVWLFARIPVIKKSKLLQAVLILSCLWLFSLLTGGAASVIRSAVMFSFITLGKTVLKKQASIFSSLAASAFVMLCYNPYYLWDVGFQLSYLAVTGIVIFQKPLYHLLYVKNKWLDKVWQLCAVSLAAQVLTFPVCIYYFHQFPNLFLITNIIAVPLSTIILFAEIAVVALAWLPLASGWLGKLTGWLVWAMNKIILWVNSFSFAVWDGIPATILSTLLLYAVVLGIGSWLMKKSTAALRFSLLALLGFVIAHAFTGWQAQSQRKIIVYNIPRQRAVDFVNGSHYIFLGDSALQQEGLLQNFHLKPGRIALQLNKQVNSMEDYTSYQPFYHFGSKRIVMIDQPLVFEIPAQKIHVDMIIISKNPKLYIPQLAQVFNCKLYIADASNSLWKIGKWKQDCDKLHLRFHSIPEEGAFIVDL